MLKKHKLAKEMTIYSITHCLVMGGFKAVGTNTVPSDWGAGWPWLVQADLLGGS